MSNKNLSDHELPCRTKRKLESDEQNLDLQANKDSLEISNGSAQHKNFKPISTKVAKSTLLHSSGNEVPLVAVNTLSKSKPPRKSSRKEHSPTKIQSTSRTKTFRSPKKIFHTKENLFTPQKKKRRTESASETDQSSFTIEPIREYKTPLEKRVDELTGTVEKLVGMVTSISSRLSDETPATTTAPTNSNSVFTSEPGDLLFNLTEKTKQNPVNFHSGLSAGEHLPEKLKFRIWENKYVDFYTLLHPDSEGSFNLSFNTMDKPSFTLLPRKSRSLTELEWISAFDDYTAIYVRKYPEEVGSLITYGKFVKNLMAKRLNWSMYDSRFRKDREFSLCPWTTIRIDLQIQASFPPQSNNFPQNREIKRVFSQPSQISNIPVGYCFKFHTPGQYCQNTNCQFKHACPNCNKHHPIYRDCRPAYNSNRVEFPRPFHPPQRNSSLQTISNRTTPTNSHPNRTINSTT